MRWKSRVAPGTASVLILALLLSARDVAAQPTDFFGFQQFHTHVTLEPFEHLDTQSGRITYTFTDLVLPGNRGRDLRFARVGNGMGTFGLAGMVMAVLGGGYVPPGTVFSPETPELFRERGPVLHMADGAQKQTFYTTLPVASSHESQRWVVSVDGLKYDQEDRRLYMKDGAVCRYDFQLVTHHYLLRSCEDTFGTFLEIDRDPGTSTMVVRQDLGNAEFREVVFAGANTVWSSFTSMTYEGRTWQYAYTSGGGIVTGTVTPPVGPGWTFTWTSSPFVGPLLTRIVTPGGGQIDYTYEERFQTYPDYPAPGIEEPQSHGYFLATREVSGPGVTNGTWTFFDFSFQAIGAPTPERFRVTPPSGTTTTYWNDICVFNPYNDAWIVGGGLGTCWIYNSLRGVTHDDTVGYFITYGQGMILKTYYRGSRVISTADGTQTVNHTTHYQYDQYMHPLTTREYTSLTPGVERLTTRTYLNTSGASGPPYLIGLPTSETVEISGESFATTRVFNSTSGFLESESVGGIVTTFTPDARGNRATATKNGATTSYTYDWGVLKHTQTPAYTIARAINPDGTVQSETQANRTTTYQYDVLGRLTSVQGPGGAVPTTTVYNNSTARDVVTTRGTSRVRTTMDGFGRPILTETGSTSAYQVRTATGYDGEGRTIFAGYPVAVGLADIGTQLTYDGLGRIRIETNPDGTTRERTYGTGTVTIRDEENRTSVFTRQMFGTPQDGRIVQLVEAAGAAWSYAYNVVGSLTGVTGPGGITRTWTYHPTSKLLQSETHPESGTVQYTQYQGDVLTQKVDASGTVFQYTHDTNNRLTGVTATPTSGPAQVTTITYEPGTDQRQTATVGGASTVWATSPW
jgi:YD repeat-containing protein